MFTVKLNLLNLVLLSTMGTVQLRCDWKHWKREFWKLGLVGGGCWGGDPGGCNRKFMTSSFCVSLVPRTLDKLGNEADIRHTRDFFYLQEVSVSLFGSLFRLCCVCCGPLANQIQGACSLDHSRVVILL